MNGTLRGHVDVYYLDTKVGSFVYDDAGFTLFGDVVMGFGGCCVGRHLGR